MVEIVVTGGSAEPIPWGDWGLAVMLEIAYKHPRDGKRIQYAKTSASGVTSRSRCTKRNGPN
jgi:hypothetical protein